uniref:Uncharacterized protein n=1 Tax=Anguilla anguilla TaxID=7936 RepID=A0A0E9Y093_ANGAN
MFSTYKNAKLLKSIDIKMTPSYGTTNNIGYLASSKSHKMYFKAMLPNISSILSSHLVSVAVVVISGGNPEKCQTLDAV